MGVRPPCPTTHQPTCDTFDSPVSKRGNLARNFLVFKDANSIITVCRHAAMLRAESCNQIHTFQSLQLTSPLRLGIAADAP
jgi:hypothetical protein